jgi:undecaprenyl-diphosphatase
MTIIEALIMGIIQGVAEFLPISSSGHLAIFENILKINTDTGILYDVMLHVGTLVAIFVAFRKDIARLILEFCRIIYDIIQNSKTLIHNKKSGDAKRYKKIVSNNYRKMILLIIVSTIPTGIIGLLMKNVVTAATATLLAPGIGLLITSVLLLVVDYFKAGQKIPKDVNYWHAMAIGVCQGLATFPGVSRSGTTIVACLLCGFNRKFAVKYSFLMSIPAVMGAAILELKDIPGLNIGWEMMLTYLAGTVLAGLVGYVCIKTMLVMVQKKKFRYFSIYCFLMGIVAIVCHFAL